MAELRQLTWRPTQLLLRHRQDSVLLLTDSTQAKVAEYGYLPYGNTYTNTGTQAAANPYRYISAFLDATGNYKMGARYYNPTIGRFTQTDPSGQEYNRYNYSSSNPVTYSDPSGLLDGCEIAALVIIGGVAAVATGGLALPEEAALTSVDVAGAAGAATAGALSVDVGVGGAFDAYDSSGQATPGDIITTPTTYFGSESYDDEWVTP